MFIVRPIQQADFDGLKRIATESGHGFTSLPMDDRRLKEKIVRSIESTEKSWSSRGEESYLFVMEDTVTGEIIGTTGIEASVGTSSPLYHYRISQIIQSSIVLDIYKKLELLTVCNDYTGASEICTLYLDAAHRKNKLGRFLSKVRFMFMADHQERFSETVIAEMRGVVDGQGIPPFWRWLQEHFFSIDFETADFFVGMGSKGFISELMPKHPIFVSTLSTEAQEVIGQVHKNTKPALELLLREGFEFRGYIDLFDAGPTVETKLERITSVTNSFHATVHIDDTINEDPAFNPEMNTYAICNLEVSHFRAAISQHVKLLENNSGLPQIRISKTLAAALSVVDGCRLRVLAL